MARFPRLIIPGAAYHITARGNYRQEVFFSDPDRRFYLDLLARHAFKYGLQLLGWCLMSNHIHLLATEIRAAAMTSTLKRVQSEYAFRMNQRIRQASGHLWQSRFYSAPIDPAAVWTVLRYIELNPVRAEIVDDPATFAWSTAAFHSGIRDSPPSLSMQRWAQVWTPESWKNALSAGLEADGIRTIRDATKRGLPCGTADFIRYCEIQTARSLTRRPTGRPRIQCTAANTTPARPRAVTD